MKYFTVKDISSILSVNEETVRRWIREDKLYAERGSGRQGSKISEESLKRFLKNNKASITSTASQIISGVGVLGETIGGMAAGVAGGMFNSVISTSKSNKSSKKEIMLDLLNKEMELENNKREKEVEIFKLKKELELIEMQIEKMKIMCEEFN